MADKEWLQNIQYVSNFELIQKLGYCGHDSYYDDFYYPIVKEIIRRLGEVEDD